MVKNRLIKPFVKWAGGKRQLLTEIRKYIPKKITTYYEPFLGGGAVFFDIQPKKFIISDVNTEIINVYEVIKNNVEALLFELKQYKNDQYSYYKIRELDRSPDFLNLSEIQRAARIIYLNKTCYNGLFRVNSQGQFNVPFGNYKNPDIVNEITLKAVSKFLQESDGEILSMDFEKTLGEIKKGSFVYLDPPYDPISDSASFTGYTLDGFGKEEQIRLKKICDYLTEKDCKFLLSNSSTDFIKSLYKDFKIEIVQANRNINSISSSRGKIDEVLIRNYD